jgi:hypothetical protein
MRRISRPIIIFVTVAALIVPFSKRHVLPIAHDGETVCDTEDFPQPM